MAQQPTVISPSVPAGGGQELRGRAPRGYQAPAPAAGLAGTAEGQGAALGQGLQALGQGLGRAADFAYQDARAELALQNETMALEADTHWAAQFSNAYSNYARLEGKAAVAGQQAALGELSAMREEALKTMPNDAARAMLNRSLTRRQGFYAESIGRYAASEDKKWRIQAAEGAARGQADQASVFRNVPDLVEANLDVGEQQIQKIGEQHGWDQDTLTANQRQYRGRAVGAIVNQLLGDGNVEAAVALFERNQGRMDATSAGHIAQALKPARQKAQAQADYATVMGTGPGTATTIGDAILMQESGGRDGQVSVDGARGRMQIMPGTFAQFAQSGESIDNPADNERVGRRIIDAYSQRWGGDPERVAVAYFSGPGNVSEPGSPHPWKEDKRDGNGMTVSRYVAQVSARLKKGTEGAPTYERPDFAGARERAMVLAGDDPDRLQRLLARINQGETQYNSTTKAERDTMTARLNDVQAQLADGRSVAIPETDIRRLYPREKADEIIGKLNETQQLGYAFQTVQFATPEEIRTMLAGYDDVGRAPGGTDAEMQAGYAQRAKFRQAVVTALQRREEQLKADPAKYVLQAPAVQASVAQGEEAYARASLGEQARIGVPETERRVLPKAQASALVQQVMEADPAKTPVALVLNEMSGKYGAMWPAVFRDMVRSGLPPEYAILGSMDAPDQVGARGDAQRMLALKAEKGGMRMLREAVGSTTDAKSIDDGVDTALAPFRETTRFMTGGAELYARTRDFVQGMAYYYGHQGANPSQAVAQAVGGVLGAKYEFSGSMRVPRGMLAAAKEVAADIQAQLGAEALAAVPDGPMAETTRSRLLTAAQNGFWVPNADDTGLVLMAQYRNGAAGIPVYEPVRRAGGERVEVRFDQLDALRNAAATRNSERRATLPTRPPIDALGNPVLVAPR